MMEIGFSSTPPEAHPSPASTPPEAHPSPTTHTAQRVGADNNTRTPTLAGRQMSASLRERLKRSGRSYSSSPTTTKRLQRGPTQHLPQSATWSRTPHLDTPSPTDLAKPVLQQIPPCCHGDATDKVHVEADTENTCPTSRTVVHASPTSRTVVHASLPCDKVVRGVGVREDVCTLRVARLNLRDSIAKKEERLRKLKMVKMYRAKNDLRELSTLITKWRDTSQGALHELLDLTQADPKPTLTLLVQHLGIDPKLLHLNPEDATFT